MKTKLKRTLGILVALVIVIGLLPVATFTEPTDATIITLTRTDGTTDPQTPISPADMTGNTISASDGSWTYTKDTNTLTLNNWSGQRITANGSFNLHLIGNNIVTLNDEYNAKGIEVTTTQYVYVGINMTAASGGKLTIQSPTGGLNNSFHGIYFERESYGTFNIKSGELLIDISSSNNDWSYGIRGGLEFKGKTTDIAKAAVRLSNTRDSGTDGLVGFYKLIIEDEDNIEVDVNVTANGANRACTGIEYMNVHNTNAKIKVVADNTATDDLTKENAVYSMYNTSLKQGGKIETTGRVAFREYFYTDNYLVFIFGKNTKTTLPADNKFLTTETWENGSRFYVYSDTSGESLRQMVIEHSPEVADFEWLGGSLTIPDGTLKVGELYSGEYLHQYLRGFERLEHVRFEVTSGELPAGLSIGRIYIYGSPTEPCEGRTVTITATDNRGTSSDTTDDRTQSFDVIIGKVGSAKPVTAVSPAETNVSMEVGGTKEIEVSVNPEDASYPDLRLTNSDTAVVYASVSEPDTTGKSTVTLKSIGRAGTAKIDVISKDTGVKASINVTVSTAATTISGTKDGMSSATSTQAKLILGNRLDLLSLVQLSVPNYRDEIDFEVESSGTTGAAVTNKRLSATGAGVAKIKATFAGKDVNGDGLKEYGESTYSFYVRIVNKTVVTLGGYENNQKFEYDGEQKRPIGSATYPAVITASDLRYTFTGRDGTIYSERLTPPINAGKYTMIVRVSDTNPEYAGELRVDYEITLRSNVSIVGNEVTAANGTASTAVLVVAAYNAKGLLVDMKKTDVSANQIITRSPADLGLITTGATKIKAMLLKDFATMVPLAPSKESNL